MRYAGRCADKNTRLQYNTFRYYDPNVGRFVSQNPIGLAGGNSLHQYAAHPSAWFDPFGLAFDTGKGIHTANATLFDGEGNENVVLEGTLHG